MRIIIFLCFYASFLFSAQAQTNTVRKNTELFMLNIRLANLNIDSARIQLTNNSYIDIFLKSKLIWNIKKYTNNGIPISIGDFKDGNGFLDIDLNGFNYKCSFLNGEFHGKFSKFRINKKQLLYLDTEFNYSNGIANGNATFYTATKKNHIKTIVEYSDGIKIMQKEYGEYVPVLHFFQVRIIYKYDSLCREQFYEKGKKSEQICHTKIRHCDCP